MHRLAKDQGGCDVQRVAEENRLKVDDTFGFAQHVEHIFHMLPKHAEILILHPDELTPQEFPRMLPRGPILVKDAFPEKPIEGVSPRAEAEILKARGEHRLNVFGIESDETGVAEEGLLDVRPQSIVQIGKQAEEPLVPVGLEASPYDVEREGPFVGEFRCDW